MFSVITEGVEVNASIQYLPEQSSSQRGDYIYRYQITITNRSKNAFQLLRRRWLITNGLGVKRIVEGEGVVGEKPMLYPGETFSYHSWCPLDTEIGCMEGSYFMSKLEDNLYFEVKVPTLYFFPDYLMN